MISRRGTYSSLAGFAPTFLVGKKRVPQCSRFGPPMRLTRCRNDRPGNLLAFVFPGRYILPNVR
jgi:hypothetical protein